MAEKYWLFNSAPGDPRKYQASDFAQYFGKVLTNGLLHINSVPGLGVKTKGTDLQTYVEIGGALIDGYMYENTTDLDLSHGLPEPTLDRIDRIVLRADKRNNARYIRAFVKEGVPATEPVPPTLQRDAFVHELSLAQVRVRANTSTLLSSDIIDERLDDELCGLVFSLIGLKSVEKIQYGQYSLTVTQQGQRAFEIPTENFDKAKDGLLVFVNGDKAPFGSYEVVYPRTVSFVVGLNQDELIEFQVTRGVLDIPPDFAFKASDIGIEDPGKYFIADNVQEVLQEVGKDVRRLEHETANLSLYSEASQRLKDSFLFGTNFATSFGMEVDFTRSSSLAPLTLGQTEITVDDGTGFKIGQEVTVYDNVNLERVVIQSIAGYVLTVSPLQKAYKAGANVARSMAVEDTFNDRLKFGVWGTYEPYDMGLVVASTNARSFEGNVNYRAALIGQELFVVKGYTSNTYWFATIIKRNASGVWSDLAGGSVDIGGVAGNMPLVQILAIDNLLWIFSNNKLRIIRPDGTLVKDQAISYAGGKILYNIEAKKLSIWGTSMVSYSWDTSYTLTNLGTETPIPSAQLGVGYMERVGDAFFNARVYGSSLFFDSSKPIYGTPLANGWTTVSVPTPSGFHRSLSIFKVNGIMHHVYMKTDLAVYERTSINDGVSWAAESKIGNIDEIAINQTASQTTLIDSRGDVFVGFKQGSSAFHMKYTKNSNTWSSINKYPTKSMSSGSSIGFANADHITLVRPIISLDNFDATNSLSVDGSWIVGNGAEILVNDVRFTTLPTQEVVSWIERQDGCTIANATLNGYPMDLATVGNETQLVGEKPNLDIAEVRFTMTRESVGHNAKVTKIIGGNG